MLILPQLLLTVTASFLSGLALAVPHRDSPQQRLANGLELPEKFNTFNKKKAPPPYTPDHRDPLDRAIDTVGKELDPLPFRNGLGASVLGPWNKERSRQSPDLVRPPSTDHGNMANMRWSFADSHVRIEVSFVSPFMSTTCVMYVELKLTLCPYLGRRMDAPDHRPRASHQRRAGQCEHAPW